MAVYFISVTGFNTKTGESEQVARAVRLRSLHHANYGADLVETHFNAMGFDKVFRSIAQFGETELKDLTSSFDQTIVKPNNADAREWWPDNLFCLR